LADRRKAEIMSKQEDKYDGKNPYLYDERMN
jgi:hypothetical protein